MLYIVKRLNEGGQLGADPGIIHPRRSYNSDYTLPAAVKIICCKNEAGLIHNRLAVFGTDPYIYPARQNPMGQLAYALGINDIIKQFPGLFDVLVFPVQKQL